MIRVRLRFPTGGIGASMLMDLRPGPKAACHLKVVGRPGKPNCLKKNDNFRRANDSPWGRVCKSAPQVTLPALRGGLSRQGHTGGFSPRPQVQSASGGVINGSNTG